MPEKITALVPKGKKDAVTCSISIHETVPLPLKAGQEIGTLTVSNGEQNMAKYPLTAGGNVEKASFRELAARKISGLWN